MARLAQVLLAITLLVALPTGAYLTGAMVGPPPRAVDPPPATTTPATTPEARAGGPARTREPAAPTHTGEVVSTSAQQPRQPQVARPGPATKADDRPAVEATDEADRDGRRGPAERGRANRGRPDTGPPASRGRGAPSWAPGRHPVGPPAAATVKGGPAKPAKPASLTPPADTDAAE